MLYGFSMFFDIQKSLQNSFLSMFPITNHVIYFTNFIILYKLVAKI